MDETVQSTSRIGRFERCIIGKDELLLPDNLIEQTSIFSEVINSETWEKVLSPSQRHYLMKFLPTFPTDDLVQKQITVKRLLDGDNFKFGNPLKKFQTKLKEGAFSSEISKYPHLYRKFKFRDYKMQQQRYYTKLLKEIIMSRQRVFEMVSQLPPDELPKFCYNPPPPADQSIEHLVNRRCRRILKEVQEECNADDTSSEEELEDAAQKNRKQLLKSSYSLPSPEPAAPAVLATYSTKPVTNGEITDNNNSQGKKVRRLSSPIEFSDEDYKAMLRDYKRRKMENADLPEMDINSITLQDILARCQAGKKPVPKSPSNVPESTASTSPASVKKVKKKGEKIRKLKAGRVDSIAKRMSISSHEDAANLEIPELLNRDEECVPDFPLPEALPPKLPFGQYDNFFSLLRDLINEFPDSKVTTAKLEEKVRDWQESPTTSLNPWLSQQSNWIDNVIPALKFLSGDVLGFQVENFVPFLDYKERAQQWKWIGQGRDVDEQLGQLCKYWLSNKDEKHADTQESNPGSPPPPRVKTNYVVKPTTDEEKLSFKEQERKRFESPHLGFTYHMHGYDSVVGPVKGVYSKDNAMNKAREHALLISDRPSYVTILTLVRDAAARLPNGEGTRGDICELLKDSQFLAPAITDVQINTVVSGALDRLHYEKDPCVKYDVNRKLWIYLHRSRTEEEFEKIHQAQGAAVKAKKSLQKPKSSKSKAKEAVVSNAVVSTAHSSVPSQGSRSVASVSIASTENKHITTETVTSTSLVSPAISANPKLSTQNTCVITATTRTLQGSTKSGLGGTKPATINLSLAQAPSIGGSGSTVTTIPISEITKAQTPAAGSQGHTTISASPSTLSKPFTFAIVPSQATVTSGSPTIVSQGRTSTTNAKPLSLNLLPSHLVTKSVVITTKPELIPFQQHSIASTGGSINSSKSLVAGQTILSTANRTAVSSATTATPMVARLVSGPQMVSVGNLLPGPAHKNSSGNPGPTTIKIQGSNILQPISGGKPVQLTGKAMQTTKGILQIDGKAHPSVNVIQTAQGGLSTINIIPQGGNATVVSLSEAAQTTKSNSSTVTADSGTTTVLSSALQSATVMSQLKTVTVTTTGSTLLTQQPLQMVNQPKVVSPGQGGIVVTHLAPGNITLRPGLSGVSQAKVVTAAQASLVPAQFILHQPATGNVKVGGSDTSVTPTVTQATPIIVSSNSGKPAQNIQVVRTVLSQPSSVKPGQTTILISQPALQQSGTTVLSSAQLLQTAKMQGKLAGKGKPPPVYARILTPTAGMKLATVASGQALTAQGVSVIQAAAASKLTSSAITATVSSQAIKSQERSSSTTTTISSSSSSNNSNNSSSGNSGGGIGSTKSEEQK